MNPKSTPPSKEDILIVDDSPDNLRVLSTTLTRQGYGVRCAKSGAMALMGVQTFPPDLILLDIRMPEMDGYEVCRQIKANPKTQDIAIIFLSALDDVLDKVRAFQVGGADYITKPFETAEVLARVQHQLVIRRLQKQLTQQNQQLRQEIGDRKRVEETLRQEISQRILTEAALQDAKEVAEAANDVQGEFLSRMSHELRTPLNAILGFAQLLAADQALVPEHREYVQTIHQNGQHLLKLVNNILTFANPETSPITLHEQGFDLAHMLDLLEATWQPKVAVNHLQLVVERAPKLPRYIRSDESKLHQVLGSLLENAIKFTQQGQITLRVQGGIEDFGVEPFNTPSAVTYPLYFEVEDTGCSMAADEIEKSFELFTQTTSGLRSERGLGLGLSISRQFVNLMGGDIRVESKAGKGTRIKFHIQVHSCTATELAPMTQTQTDPGSLEPTEEPTGFPGLTPEMLRTAMPMEWVYRLHQAAIRGFDQPIFQLVQEIPASQSSIAKTLARWSRNFQFEKILALTQPIVEGGLSHITR